MGGGNPFDGRRCAVKHDRNNKDPNLRFATCSTSKTMEKIRTTKW